MNGEKRRVGIFGGTFDPIHIGHLFLAEAAYDRFGLDEVLIMPAPDPYHRTDKKVLPEQVRCEMVNLAIADNPHFRLSEFELRLPRPTFTSTTLEAFQKENPDTEIFFILGGDSLFSIESWKDPEKIFSLATILSGKRENESRGASGSCGPDGQFVDLNKDGVDDYAQAKDLDEEFRIRVSYLREKYGARVYDLEVPSIEVSSSGILSRIREGRSVKYYLPDRVLDYIIERGLYLEDNAASD